jgi:SAM-dependent methyltransferase
MQVQVWHHGLVAQSWAEFSTDGGQEAGYFEEMIRTYGQPALDLGCGSGRLLFLFLKSGLEVDGCDVSQDMIAQCRIRAEREGFSPRLYTLALHELDLPQRYRTIFSCGVIGLGGERQLTRLGMKRIYEHLRPGGAYVFDYQVRWNDHHAWLSRLPENRKALPDEWPNFNPRLRLADGSELEEAVRTVSMDALENVAVRQYRLRLWQGEEMVKEEIHTMKLEDYSKNELVMMLEEAGFEDIQIYGDYTHEPANTDHENLVFVARK